MTSPSPSPMQGGLHRGRTQARGLSHADEAKPLRRPRCGSICPFICAAGADMSRLEMAKRRSSPPISVVSSQEGSMPIDAEIEAERADQSLPCRLGCGTDN